VHSAEASLDLNRSGFAFRGEYAQSLFTDPNLCPLWPGSITGTAMALTIVFTSLPLAWTWARRDVSSGFVFIALPGQKLDAGFQALGIFPRENSLYNPNPSLTVSLWRASESPKPPGPL